MVPGVAAGRSDAAPVPRFGVIYVPNGMAMRNWTPTVEGEGFELTRVLEPLAQFRRRLTVLTGLAARQGLPQRGEGAGDHARAAAAFLTGAHPTKTEGRGLGAGTSVDQIATTILGQETPVPSIELTLDSTTFVGACDIGYSCAYTNTIAWRTPHAPLPMVQDPRVVFERLFGDAGTTNPEIRFSRAQRARSLLDSVTHAAVQLKGSLGPSDRAKLDDYLDAVRESERRIQRIEERRDREIPVVDQPETMPASFEEHATLMCDLLVLGLQSDATRVFTFMLGREGSGRTYPTIGVPDGHHAISHHQNNPEKLAQLATINRFHVEVLAYFLGRLAATIDAAASLLDQTIVLYGAGLSDPDRHDHTDLPILVAGGSLGMPGGRHLRLPSNTPLANLHLTILQRLGVATDHFGDSTGTLSSL
jgi:hypothetical protein